MSGVIFDPFLPDAWRSRSTENDFFLKQQFREKTWKWPNLTPPAFPRAKEMAKNVELGNIPNLLNYFEKEFFFCPASFLTPFWPCFGIRYRQHLSQCNGIIFMDTPILFIYQRSVVVVIICELNCELIRRKYVMWYKLQRVSANIVDF